MPDVPHDLDPVLEVVDNIVKGLIYGAGVNAAVAAATAYVPFLGLPVISTIFRAIVTKIAGMIYVPLERSVAFEVIKFQTEEEEKAYSNALGALQVAQISGDANAVEKAKEDLKSKLASIIHFDGK